MSTDNAYKLNQLGINVTYFWKPTSTSFSLQLLSKKISTHKLCHELFENFYASKYLFV